MPTYRNPGRLDVADTAAAGTDVLIRGPEWTCRRGVCGCPYVGGIGEVKVGWGARKKVTGVGGANNVVSGAASGDGGTGMLNALQMKIENWMALNMSFRRSKFHLIP